jgi:hypothetical protein
LIQLNAVRERGRIVQKSANPEAIMTELSEPAAATGEQSPTGDETRLTQANKQVLHFIFDVQRATLEEIAFAGIEMFDRVRTEMHLLSEFVSKTASAHSARDLKTMSEECSRHQLEFLHRDNERLFKHAERMIETTSNLFSIRPQN